MKNDTGIQAPSFEQVAKCVHCGFCIETCPTYRELRVEADSPRGRIYLMKGVFQDRIETTEQVLTHIDQCLGCRACESACPSGVDYAHLLERSRAILGPPKNLPLTALLLRWLFLKVLLPSRRRQAVYFKTMWILQSLGLLALGRALGRIGLLPGKLGAAASQSPPVPFSSFRGAHRGKLVFPARGTRKHRVALFTGCLADQLLAEVNEATVRVLTENGCDVEIVQDEGCCGALHIHNGELLKARELARANVAAFGAANPDIIISNAAGCSAELRHYGNLLEGDPAAEAFGKKVRDVSEFLVEIGWTPPSGRLEGKVAYDEPCHLLHAQKVSSAPKAVLAAIPGLEVVTLEESDSCCGSAGMYSFLQPELSDAILARKIEAIRRSGAGIVVTANPGCILQLRRGVQNAGLPVRVTHLVELLAKAYAKAPSGA